MPETSALTSSTPVSGHAALSRLGSAAIIGIAISGGVVPGLQTLILGTLVTEGRLTIEQIGQTATIEALSMGLASTFASTRFSPDRLRLKAGTAILAAMLANLATTQLDGMALQAVRIVNGISTGILMWLLVGMFARAAVPARMFAVYSTAQAVASLTLSSLFSALILPRFGSTGAYGALIGLGLIMLLPVLFLLPQAYRPLSSGGGPTTTATPSGNLPGPLGFLGLVVVALHIAGVMGLWAYMAPYARTSGLSPGMTGLIVSTAFACQIVGGLSASVFATKLRDATALRGSLIALLAALAILAFAPPGPAYLVAVAMIGVCWMFAPPFQMPYLIRLDPSRRAAMLISPAQLFGSASGPVLASLVVSDQSVRPVLGVSFGLLAASLALLLLSHQMHQRGVR